MIEAFSKPFSEFLPEIFQGDSDSFTNRYLSIFQTLFEEAERLIDKSDELYDVETAPDGFIEEMARWLAIDDEDILFWKSRKKPRDLRNVLQNIPRLYKTRGTLESLFLFIELYCGGVAYFAESYHVARYYESQPETRYLYTDCGWSTLWVIVDCETISEDERQELEYLIEKNKPFYVNAELILLHREITLGDYCYLEINSVVAEHPQADLSEGFKLDYTVLK